MCTKRTVSAVTTAAAMIAAIFFQPAQAEVKPLGAPFNIDTNGGAGMNIARDAAGDSVVVIDDRFFVYDPSGTQMAGPVQIPVKVSTSNASVAMDDSGDFVVAWADNLGNYRNVYVQRYSRDGTPNGGRIYAGYYVPRNGTSQPKVAMSANGDFVVVWRSVKLSLYQGAYRASYTVYARAYRANGHSRSLFPVTAFAESGTVSYSYEGISFYDPDVAIDNVGDFVVAWSDSVVSGDPYTSVLMAQRYNAAAQPQGAAFTVQSPGALSGVAMAGDGHFIIEERGGTLYRYASNGTSQGTQTVAITGVPSLAMDRGGNYVVAWPDCSTVDQNLNCTGAYGQYFTADGSVTGSAFAIGADAAIFSGDFVRVALDGAGQPMAAWFNHASYLEQGQLFSGP